MVGIDEDDDDDRDNDLQRDKSTTYNISSW